MPRIVPSQLVQVIENYFPQTKNTPRADFTLDRSHRNECVSIAEALGQVPSELLSPPTMGEYVELISNIAVLNHILESWKTPSVTHIDNLSGKGKGNPISIIHDILLKCPDEAVSANAAGLEFIDDMDLRNSLRLDLSSVNSALSNGEWKAATVLAGSVTEALLLWAIREVSPARQTDIDAAMASHNVSEKDLNRWVLDHYNKVAKDLSIIQDRTFNQVDLAREFRNYIHPGREIREKVRCGVGTAHSAVAAVELVIEDLSRYFGKP